MSIKAKKIAKKIKVYIEISTNSRNKLLFFIQSTI